METWFRGFWLLLTIACLVWYSTMTIFVAVKGGYDIRDMIARLKERSGGEKAGQ